MATTEELTHFSHFAAHQLENGGSDSSLEELLAEWRMARERQDANEGIQRGLADVAAGRTQPAREFLAEARRSRSS
ncbi:MAG: hypothetical protein O3A00_07810 [Planctomycetota bacterium]|nr:hypothetical protein [Planctomycetota bacterium]